MINELACYAQLAKLPNYRTTRNQVESNRIISEMPKMTETCPVSRLRLNDHRVSIWASLGVFHVAVVAVVVPIDSRTPFFLVLNGCQID